MIVKGVERSLLSLNYDYFKPPNVDYEKTYDEQERPSQKPSYYPLKSIIGGLFTVVFESGSSSEDDFFAEWLSEGYFFDGYFEIYRKKNQDEALIRIEFWDCFVADYKEVFVGGRLPMVMMLRLSPGITKNRGILHEKVWKFTDLSTDGEYAQDVPVENVKLEEMKGKIEAYFGDTLEYQVTRYSSNDITEELKSQIKWMVTVDGNNEKLTDKVGDVIKIPVKENWLGKKIIVTAYLDSPEEGVSKATNIKRELILLYWVDDRGANMMSESAQTRMNNIKKSNWFNTKAHLIHCPPVQRIDEIITITKNWINKYGGADLVATREVGVFSHSGPDGPLCYAKSIENYPLDEKKRQMSLEGWGKIEFNWKKYDAICVFYGCRSGLLNGQSFAKNISMLLNYADVDVWGQGASSYPSFYPDYRVTTGLRVTGYGWSLMGDCQTYMVGCGKGKGFDALYTGSESNNVNKLTILGLTKYPKAIPMNKYKNGKHIQSSHQGIFNDHR